MKNCLMFCTIILLCFGCDTSKYNAFMKSEIETEKEGNDSNPLSTVSVIASQSRKKIKTKLVDKPHARFIALGREAINEYKKFYFEQLKDIYNNEEKYNFENTIKLDREHLSFDEEKPSIVYTLDPNLMIEMPLDKFLQIAFNDTTIKIEKSTFSMKLRFLFLISSIILGIGIASAINFFNYEGVIRFFRYDTHNRRNLIDHDDFTFLLLLLVISCFLVFSCILCCNYCENDIESNFDGTYKYYKKKVKTGENWSYAVGNVSIENKNSSLNSLAHTDEYSYIVSKKLQLAKKPPSHFLEWIFGYDTRQTIFLYDGKSILDFYGYSWKFNKSENNRTTIS